ncbi:MAG: hypothetical protein IPJ77_21920 [Planctomycetes bacterium]|nr:hypothetical protein [Planctomycetota bacterium]
MAKAKNEPKPRERRSEEQRIAELEARIAELKARAERKKAKKDPALRHVSAALRSVDKALGASQDQATRRVLSDARANLAAVLSLGGGSAPAQRSGGAQRAPRGSGGSVDAARLLQYVTQHPGLRGEQLSEALGTDSTSMRPVMHRLIEERKVRTTGQRRGMQYYPA